MINTHTLERPEMEEKLPSLSTDVFQEQNADLQKLLNGQRRTKTKM